MAQNAKPLQAVIETTLFSRRADALLSIEERASLIDELARNPHAGDVMAGLGGVRKLRFAPSGRGRSGAFRVIYYVLSDKLPVLALLLCGKNEQSDVSRKGDHDADFEYEARRAMSDDTEFGRELITSLQEAASILRGETDALRVHLPPGAVDVRAIRDRLGLSRAAFADRFGLAIAAIRDWEQGLRRPDPAARVLLLVIARNPEAVSEAVAESRAA